MSPPVLATASHRSLALLDHLARVGRREAEASLDNEGLRARHLVALTLLRDHGSTTQQGLGEALRLDPSNLVGLLNELEGAGLVLRRRDPSDRRRHIVELASTGGEALDRAEHQLRVAEERVLRALSEEERATLHALLVRAAGDQLPSEGCTAAAGDPLRPPCVAAAIGEEAASAAAAAVVVAAADR
jgi:DNA-binding MarR family transcriptional regulator